MFVYLILVFCFSIKVVDSTRLILKLEEISQKVGDLISNGTIRNTMEDRKYWIKLFVCLNS